MWPELRHSSLRWCYDRAELRTDAIIHVVGVGLATSGSVLLLVFALDLQATEFTAVLLYVVGLNTMIGVSALYNMWPVSPTKWHLRRLDHSAIYLLIAGTYTPFLVQMRTGVVPVALLVGIWLTAAAGVVLKIALPGRLDRLSILIYLALGWSGVALYDEIFAALPMTTVWWLGAGGALYTAGVVFHVWQNLRFQNAIWHAFVLLAAICHYGAVLDTFVLARA